MKNYFFIATSSLLLFACNSGESDKVKLERSMYKVDSLIILANERESSINDFISSFNEVERNLDSVTVKQHIILINSDKKVELKKDQKDRINEEIASINMIMDRNYKMITELESKLKGSGYKNEQLKKTIIMLNEQLTQKNIELTDLNERLFVLNAQVAQLQTWVDTLSFHSAKKDQYLSEKTAALHTAYYVIGKSKELEEAKIIDKKGGLLGIGRTSKLNEDFDRSKFIQIDYTETGKIAINDDIKIVTNHPSDSYTLDRDIKDKDLIKNIIITNPEKFWSASKYLVIVKG